ncbi:MAG: histidine kinase dimerization/phospho-acceptor domain-containing protein, partial [Stellaceae bacterium]
MAEVGPRVRSQDRAGQSGTWRIALLRLLCGGLTLWLPAGGAFAVLAGLGLLLPLPAALAAVATYAGMLFLLKPLIFGLAAVQMAVEAMAADERPVPEVQSRAPSVRELWVVLARWARGMRLRLKARDDERDAARAVLAALPQPLLVLDDDRRVVRANAAAEVVLGERLIDRDLAGGLRHPAVLAATDAVLRGEGPRVVEFDMATPVERHLSVQIAPLGTRTPEGGTAVLLLNDLTAVKRSEQLRADFVANASHELRTPLASLVGFIETLRGPAREDRAAGQRFLDIMAEQAARMQRLVEDLLSLSRIEMNEHRPPAGAVEIGQVVRTAAETLEQRAAQRGMRIAVAVPAD